MFTLTHAQSAQINSAEYTITYEAEAENISHADVVSRIIARVEVP